jgi:hypothetical protein
VCVNKFLNNVILKVKEKKYIFTHDGFPSIFAVDPVGRCPGFGGSKMQSSKARI